jgi:hypothetical protein
MLLAPILAVALVLSLAAAVSYLPSSHQNQPSAEPTPSVYYNVTPSVPSPSAGSYNVATPAPTSAAAPTPVPLSGITSVNLLPALSVAAAIILGIVAALLLFSEKSLKKELSKDD